ncbi:hypothetical protein LSCM1_08120 [Leishmania martiniquensis]|uniref:Uncharacterized protein n=1 Tax=Leishmania martiniquensis TaxID=1580590 RepID=A0A836H8E3_9TRYP|nr:hypothetical protein LSCM1_08120 [Leishmania martiniquensis]
MASTPGVEEVAAVVAVAQAPVSQPMPPSPPPLIELPPSAPSTQSQPSQEEPEAEQPDTTLPLPLPAAPMTRRRKRSLASTRASAHYLTATTAAIARSRSPRGFAAARSTVVSPSTATPPPQPAARPQRSSSSPSLQKNSGRPLQGDAGPFAGSRRTSAARMPASQRHRPSRHSKATPHMARRARRASSAASPYGSLIDAVLDEQFAAVPASCQPQLMEGTRARISDPVDPHGTTGVAVDGDDAIVVEVVPSERRGRGGGVAARRQRRRTLSFSDASHQVEEVLDPDDSVDSGEAATAPLQLQALRLQPLPPAAPASALIEEAVLASGADSEFVDAFVDVAAVSPTLASRATQSAARSSLMAERARLLHDSPCMVLESGSARGAARLDDAEARELLWRPTAEPRVVARTSRPVGAAIPAKDRNAGRASKRAPSVQRAATAPPALPAALVAFLKAEADAEAAVRDPSAAVGVGADARASPTPASDTTLSPPLTSAPFLPVLSPAAESAAVLRELKDVQRRLRDQSHRQGTMETSAGATPPDARAEACVSAAGLFKRTQRRESCSPCDVTATASSASSTATDSSSTAPKHSAQRGSAGRSRKAGLHRATSEYWVTASLAEIVDAIDEQCTAAPVRERQRGEADFHPTSYARRLLDTSARSCTPSTGTDDDDGTYTGGNYAEDDATGCQGGRAEEGRRQEEGGGATVSGHRRSSQSAPSTLFSPSSAALQREVLLRSSPTWVTAAAELGLTPAEVQDLLQYSLSSPSASAFSLAAGNRRAHDGRGVVEAAVDVQDGNGVARQRSGPAKNRSGGEGRGESPSKTQQQRPHRSDSASLDAAAQAALAQRIVAVMPAIPAELQSELNRQRRLLERIYRDVNCMSAPAHAAVRARLASPTLSFAAARQPPPVELTTGARAEAAQTNPQAAAEPHEERVQHDEYQQLLFASLPRPAAQALMVAGGLRGAAADPSRPLPPFHAVVAHPTRRALPVTATLSTGNDASAPREPYEEALRELAQREADHYISELDRLRTSYDRQLQDERHQRQQERRQYAELLQAQQRKMLRHHRETVHLLQRECRLQKQQQESLIQKLVASQSAAVQRQQNQQQQSMKLMLSGAVDVMKSCVAAEGVERGVDAGEAAAASTSRVIQRRRQRQQRQRPRAFLGCAGSGGLKTWPTAGKAAPSSAAVCAAGTSAATVPAAPSSVSSRSTSPLRPNDGSGDVRVVSRVAADGRPAEGTHNGGSAPLTASGEKAAQHRAAGITQSVVSPTSALEPAQATATQVDAVAAGAVPHSNTPEVLRAVYGGGAGPPPRRSRPQGRMTLPLHVRLPPEEDTPTHRRLSTAALTAELSDIRAIAAARDAGLAEGTRLYGVQPRRPRLSQSPPSPNTGEAGMQRLNQTAPCRALLATPSSEAADRHAHTPGGEKVVRRRSAESRRLGRAQSRSGRGRSVKSRGPSPGRRGRRTPPYAAARSGGGGRPLPRHFDTEIVSALSIEAATAPLHGASETQAPPVAPRGGVMAGRGVWAESIPEGDGRTCGETDPYQQAVDAAVVTAGVTAGKPSVGRPVLMLSQPADGGVDRVTHAAGVLAAGGTPAPCTAQAVDAQLRAALCHRAGVVRALRQMALPSCSPPGAIPPRTEVAAAPAQGDGSAGDDGAHAILNAVGSLPPCDGVFFGASAEVLIKTTDSCAVGGDSEGVLPSNLADAQVPLTMLSDYERAWTRYAAAEREVESHARTLAAEDAGVLESVGIATQHRRRGQGEEDGAELTVVTASRPASTAAAVCYRESELGYGYTALKGGSVHVSPRMAAEARALTEARRRLSAIRACFITPPPRGAACAVGRRAAGSTAGLDASVRDAALARQLVDSVVLSVLEAPHQHSHTDPVRQVMAAMEHEMLRLMVAECLEERAEVASGHAQEAKAHRQPEKPEQLRLDADLARALAEAALEDAVHAALARVRDGEMITPVTAHSDEAAAATGATRTAAADAPVEASWAPEVDAREHVFVPRTASTAWLRDDSPPPQAAPPEQGPLQPIDKKAMGEPDAITATATVTLPSSRSENHGTTSSATLRATEPATQEVRVVVDISPFVRHMMASRDLAAATPAQEPQQLYGPRPYPPVQQEQLPSRWMALEDRRDVIVEVEGGAAVAETRAGLPTPTVVKAENVAKRKPAAAPTDDDDGRLQASTVSATPAAVPASPALAIPLPAASAAVVSSSSAVVAPPLAPPTLPVPAPVELTGAHVWGTVSPEDHSDVHRAPQLMLLRLLESSLLDQERLQRASLADREEEQRHAHELLCEVAKAAAEQRSSTRAKMPVPVPEPSAVATPMAPSQMAVPQQRVAGADPNDARREEGEGAGAATSRPPPVRDAVMGFVMEWVRQFGAAEQQPSSLHDGATPASPASLAEGIAAAQRAPPHDAPRRPPPSLLMRYAASRPSTRNLGSSTSTASSSSLSPSLPSSLLMTSSSSSSLLTEQVWRPAGVTGGQRSGGQHARKARPVLDTQRDDTSSSTATTHYTTGRSSVTLAVADAAREDRAALSGSSRLLPPRAFAEVQAALATALRAHQHSQRAEEVNVAPAEENRLGVSDIPLGSAVGNSPFAVSLPAHSAEAIAFMRTPSPMSTAAAACEDNRCVKRSADEARKPAPSEGKGDKGVGAVVLVPPPGAEQPHAMESRPRSPSRTGSWVCASLTSTSTSSHSGDGGCRGCGSQPARACSAQGSAFPSSALPFMSARARSGAESTSKNGVPPAPTSTTRAPPATPASVPLPSSSS